MFPHGCRWPIAVYCSLFFFLALGPLVQPLLELASLAYLTWFVADGHQDWATPPSGMGRPEQPFTGTDAAASAGFRSPYPAVWFCSRVAYRKTMGRFSAGS